MAISKENLKYFFYLFKTESGLDLDDSKLYLMESRLEPLARNEGFTSIDELGWLLQTNPSSSLRQKVVEVMTTGETSFFRDLAPFELIKNEIIPTIIKQKEKSIHKIRIWNAACSTGQEPYSIAILISELKELIGSWDIEILATDLSEKALEKAKLGKYSKFEVQRGLPIAYLIKYFTQKLDEWDVKPEIKRMIHFQNLNFLKDHFPSGPFDIILCRNVLIYFDAETKRNVLEKMTRVMSKESVFLLGGSETTIGISDLLARIQGEKGTYYKKPAVK